MIVTNGKITLSLDNQSHIDAYLSSGWVEAKASARAAEVASEEPMNVPEPAEPVEIPQEDVKVAPAPKARVRKKQEK
jgi:hypothetical protein